jgi:hypothetical protein
MNLSLVERAVRRALEAHAGQKEGNGRPCLLHPLRLMLRMDTEVEMAAAVLHLRRLGRLGAHETLRLKRYYEAHRRLSGENMWQNRR